MKVVTTIPVETEEDMIEAFAVAYRYEEIVDDGEGGQIPNPQSKEDFMLMRVQMYFSEVLVSYFAKKAEVDRLEYIDIATEKASSITTEKQLEASPK